VVTVTGGNNATASGGGVHVNNGIDTLSGEISSNSVFADSYKSNATASGGGAYVVDDIESISGQINGNSAAAVSITGKAYAIGGGLGANSITALSGVVNNNKAIATDDLSYVEDGIIIEGGDNSVITSNVGDVYAAGGGAYVNSLANLDGEVSSNTVIATVNMGYARAYGGGVFAESVIDKLSGKLNGNTVKAASDGVFVYAAGGGIKAGSIDTLAGEVSGNTVIAESNSAIVQARGAGVVVDNAINNLSGKVIGNVASAASHNGYIYAYGGGINGDIESLSGEISGNAVIATNKAGYWAEACGGGLYSNNIDTISGPISDNGAVAVNESGNLATAHGGGVYVYNIANLSGELSGNTAAAISDSGNVEAFGGGGYLEYRIDALLGRVIDNTVFAKSNTGEALAYGGGIEAWGGIDILAGQVSGNTALAVSGTGYAEADGGGLDANSINILSGDIASNTAIAVTDTGEATALGGGMYIEENVETLSGQVLDNTASAISMDGNAYAYGGGVDALDIIAFTGEVSGNTAFATSDEGYAQALGGGVYLHAPNSTITQGLFENNQTVAFGEDARAEGGAIFVNTTYQPAFSDEVSLTLKPVDGDIIFRNNTVSVNDITTANDIAFGWDDLEASSYDATLRIGGGPYDVYLLGGVTADMKDGNFTIIRDINEDQQNRLFFMSNEETQGSGNFYWGGNNVFLTEGGQANVDLKSGITTLEPGFNLTGNNLNFTLSAGATLQVKLSAQPITINATNITFEDQSLVSVDDSSFVYGPVLTPGQSQAVLNMTATNSLYNGAQLDKVSGKLSMGAYDYQYSLIWEGGAGSSTPEMLYSMAAITDSAAGQLMFTPVSRTFVPERGGTYATQASLYSALANKSSAVIGDRQDDRIHHLAQENAAEELWAAPFYQAVRTEKQGNFAGAKVNSPGIIVGYDRKTSDRSFFGGAASVAYPDYSAGDCSTDGRDVRLFVYGGSKQGDGLEFSYLAGYGWGHLNQNRVVHEERYGAHYHNNTYTVGLGIAKPSVRKDAIVRPYLTYEYQGIKADGYSEGAGTYALSYDGQRQNVHLVRLGADVIREDEDGYVKYGLFYLGNYGDKAAETRAYFTADPTNPFTSVGAPLDRNNWGLSVDLEKELSETTELTLSYTAMWGSKGRSQDVYLNFTYKF